MGYNVYLTEFPLKNVGYYTVQEKAEEFAFNDNSYFDTILVGSSLVGKFGHIKIFQGKRFLNLFLDGNSASTGLELIIRSGKLPKVIFVETHHLQIGLNKSLINSVFQGYGLKQFLPALQSKNKLLPVIFKKIKPQREIAVSRNEYYSQIFYQMMELKKQEYNSISDSVTYCKHLRVVDSQLQYLHSQGCMIYLFEVPIEKELALSQRANFLRMKNHEMLSSTHYHWVPYDYTNFYNTNDGIHLLKSESYIYEKYLEWYFKKAKHKRSN